MSKYDYTQQVIDGEDGVRYVRVSASVNGVLFSGDVEFDLVGVAADVDGLYRSVIDQAVSDFEAYQRANKKD